MKLTSSYMKVREAAPNTPEEPASSGYKQHGFDDPMSQTMQKDINNRVLNTLNLVKTLAGRDDLSRQIAALPSEEREKYIGYWQRVKQAMDRFLEGEDTPPLTGPAWSNPKNYR